MVGICTGLTWSPLRGDHSPVGWLCPACGKGNAPDVKTCGHCAKREVQVVKVISDTSMSGKIFKVGAG